ncbi:hypothetical protein B0H13DRAFT_2392347 [Mycena leptocephala]|nr:hypothetical protein B0H13DRAFT_2392347 [Mycena leptocephala]
MQGLLLVRRAARVRDIREWCSCYTHTSSLPPRYGTHTTASPAGLRRRMDEFPRAIVWLNKFPDTDRVWASSEEDSTEQATVSSAMRGHRARALLVPPQQGEGGDCWAIRHGEYKRSTDSYAHHDHGARRRDRQSIRIRQAVLRSRSASYDN